MVETSAPVRSDRLTISQLAHRECVHAASIWRWILHGVRQTKLRSIRVGGRRFVTESDWQAFSAALNVDLVGTPIDPTSATMESRAECAGAELDKLLGDGGSRRRKTARA